MASPTTIEYIDLARAVLRNYAPPVASFAAAGSWSHRYKIYTLVSGDGTLPTTRFGGSLAIQRTPLPSAGATLAVTYEKTSQFDGLHRISGTLECAGDELSTPRNWQLTYTLTKPSQPLEIADSWRSSGSAAGRRINFTEGRRHGHLSLPASYTTSWSLFDAVQRLPRRSGSALEFTLLDPYDDPKPGQVLTFYKSAGLKDRWPGAPDLQVHGFLQIGRGISPQLYWTDDHGRLLFLIAGVDAYVLEATQGAN